MPGSLKQYGIFAGGSGIGAVIDYVVTLLAVRWLSLWPEAALGLAMLISATVVFFWHDHVTFAAARKPRRMRRYVRFMVWSAVVFGIRAVLLAVLRVLGVALPLALGAAILIASVINYVISDRAIFGRQDM